MEFRHVPIAKAQMLIRKPVAEVFEAFVDPIVTTKFWFTRSSGKLEARKEVQWDWEMYGVSSQIKVKEIERNKRILIVWSGNPTSTTVEWVFTSRPDNTTFVTISNSGFTGNGDEVVSQALDSQGGFVLVLAGPKVFLEHNISLNLVADHAPDAHKQPSA